MMKYSYGLEFLELHYRFPKPGVRGAIPFRDANNFRDLDAAAARARLERRSSLQGSDHSRPAPVVIARCEPDALTLIIILRSINKLIR